MADSVPSHALRLIITGQDMDFSGQVCQVGSACGWQIEHLPQFSVAIAQASSTKPHLFFVEWPIAELSNPDRASRLQFLLTLPVPWVVLVNSDSEAEAAETFAANAYAILTKSSIHNPLLPKIIADILTRRNLEIRLEATQRSLTQREQALRAAEYAMQLAGNTISEAITRQNAHGKFICASPALTKLLGYSAEEVIGRAATTLIVAEDLDLTRQRVRQALRDKRMNCRLAFRMVHKSGRIVWVEAEARFVCHGRRLQEIQCALRDVTEQKRAEEERHKLEARVRQAQKMESLSVMAGGMAHDFNNLLAAILSNTELASLELPPNSTIRNYLSQVIHAAHRATQLVGQMQVYSGQGRYLVQMLELAELVREFAQPPVIILSPIITLEVEFGTAVPPIQGDPLQIRQILANLVANAAEAIGDQPGTVRITTGVMHCDRACLQGCFCDESLPEGKYAYVEVSDNGCGMTAETQIKMFEPFFTTKFAGRGLGLAAVLGIVRAHAGAIKVASAPGQGSIFRVLFPAAVSSFSDRPAATPSPTAKTWRGFGTVMVVDDEEESRSTIRKHLARLGFLVTTAVDGPHALDIFRKAPNEFVCVLVDHAMPHMNGAETCQALRRIRHDIKIIVAADGSQLDTARQYTHREQFGLLEKPCCLETLQQALQTSLDNHSPA